MKRTSVLISIIFIAVLGFVSCSEEKTTELGWTNISGAAINEISWANGNAEWEKTGGYADDANTEQKEVTELEGSVDCTIDTGGVNFVTASVLIDGQSSLTLSEGESYRYDIQASKKK